MLTMHGALHPKTDTTVHRKNEERGLISISDCVNGEQRSLNYYVSKDNRK